MIQIRKFLPKSEELCQSRIEDMELSPQTYTIRCEGVARCHTNTPKASFKTAHEEAVNDGARTELPSAMRGHLGIYLKSQPCPEAPAECRSSPAVTFELVNLRLLR